MGYRFNVASALGCIALVLVTLAGAAASARAQDKSGRDLHGLMADAQRGVAEAQYRLGTHYEAQYGLGGGDPVAGRDDINLLLAFAWFQSAEKRGHPDARYARIATEYALRNMYDDDEFRQAMESVREWMKDQNAPPPASSAATSPPSASSAATSPPPARSAAALAAGAAAEDPPEASADLAAGAEDGGGQAGPAAVPDQPLYDRVARSPAQAQARAPAQVLAETARQTPERPSGPDADAEAVAAVRAGPAIDELLARGTTYLDAGDLVAARGFFELAAGRGSGAAAMLVGVTYDPGYLELAKVVGLKPDPRRAEAWYLKAIEMNHAEAESRLRALKQRLDQGRQ